MAAAGGRLAGFWSRILGPGCDGGPAVGPGGRGSTGPGGPFFLAGTGFSWSDWVRYRLDALPGGDDLVGPGPGGGDLEGPAASAADEAGGGVQEAVAQRLRLCFRQVALQGQQLQPGQQDAGGHRGVEPGLVDLVVVRGEMSQPGALPGADDVLDAGALAAGEDPHPLRPGFQLVAVRAFAQQPGQLGDVRFFYPAGRVRAMRVPAGIVGAPLADLAQAVDGGFPGGPGDLADRRLPAGAQRPAD